MPATIQKPITAPSKPPKPPSFVAKFSAVITKIDKSLLKISFMSKLPVVVRRLMIISGLFYVAIIVLFLIIALILAVVRSGNGGVGPQTSSPPKVTPTTFDNRNPSIYATDSAVLQLEEDVILHDEVLKNTEVSEPVLGVPSLNFDVNF